MIGELERLARAIETGEQSAVDTVQMSLDRIADGDNELNSFVYVDATAALARARQIDQDLAGGIGVGPLCGIPFGVKDLDDAIGMPTGRGSRWFSEGAPASRDDLHVARLRAAGGIPIGKTATPEFGSATVTVSAVHGICRNPWRLSQTPGGSSGGTASAVAAGLIPFGTASDGGGSIRSPAAFCGLPGMRPCYGRIPSYGSTHLAQNAVSFTIARTIPDTALLLDLCAGPSPYDRTCLPASELRYREAIETLDVSRMRAAYSACFGLGPIETEVATYVETGLSTLAKVTELDIIPLNLELPVFFDTYFKIEGVDRWIDLPAGLWPERQSELSEGLQAGWASSFRARLPQLAAVYTERRKIEHQVARLFETVDVLFTPTTGVSAYAAEGPPPDHIEGTPAHPFIGLAQPILPSLCNLPALSVPVGVTEHGLPVGLQIIARQHREDICLRLGRILEGELGVLRPPREYGPFTPSS